MWEHVEAGEEPVRIGQHIGQKPLTLGDICHIADRLRDLGYPMECPVQIRTPLPPRDRRVVDLRVLDFTPQPTQEEEHRD